MTFQSYSQSIIYAVDASSNLYEINTCDCSSEIVGDTGQNYTDIALDAASGNMYGITEPYSLYKINLTTARSNYIGFDSTIISLNALTFDKKGRLLAASSDDDNIYEIDISTGLASSLGSMNTSMFSGGDLAFYQNKLYLTTLQNNLVNVNLDTITNSSIIGRISGIRDGYGMTTVSMGEYDALIVSDNNDLYRLDSLNLLKIISFCKNVTEFQIFGATMVSQSEGLLNLDLGIDTTLCSGDKLLLDATTFSASYTWQDNSTRPKYEVSQAGTYWVRISTGGCETIDSIEVDYITKPIIDLGADTTMCASEEIILEVEFPSARYVWQDSSTLSSFSVSQPGTYSVIVTEDNCSSFDSISIELIECETSLIIPNVFTPNNDETNDLFIPIETIGIIKIKTSIYNRWGSLLFVSDKALIEWDGKTSQGTPVSTGVYYWTIQYTDLNNNELIQKGFVSLLR